MKFIIPIVVALVVGFALMTFDNARGAEWEVSPQAIAQAKAEGKAGVETGPGSVAVLPIRSETADILPFKWALAGIFAGTIAFGAMNRKRGKTV